MGPECCFIVPSSRKSASVEYESRAAASQSHSDQSALHSTESPSLLAGYESNAAVLQMTRSLSPGRVTAECDSYPAASASNSAESICLSRSHLAVIELANIR